MLKKTNCKTNHLDANKLSRMQIYITRLHKTYLLHNYSPLLPHIHITYIFMMLSKDLSKTRPRRQMSRVDTEHWCVFVQPHTKNNYLLSDQVHSMLFYLEMMMTVYYHSRRYHYHYYCDCYRFSCFQYGVGDFVYKMNLTRIFQPFCLRMPLLHHLASVS